jgi:hypothetical protein
MKQLIAKVRSSPTLMAVVAIVLFAALGFLAGRFLVPSKVETIHIEDTVSKIELLKEQLINQSLREQLAITEKKLQDTKVKTITVTKWLKAPDGTESRETTKTTEKDTHTDTTTDTVKDTSKDTEVVDRTRETEDTHTHVEDRKTVTFQPKWAVSAFGTLELFAPTNITNPNQLSPVLFYGASAGYRAWGPLWLELGGGGTKNLMSGQTGWWVGFTTRVTFTF